MRRFSIYVIFPACLFLLVLGGNPQELKKSFRNRPQPILKILAESSDKEQFKVVSLEYQIVDGLQINAAVPTGSYLGRPVPESFPGVSADINARPPPV